MRQACVHQVPTTFPASPQAPHCGSANQPVKFNHFKLLLYKDPHGRKNALCFFSWCHLPRQEGVAGQSSVCYEDVADDLMTYLQANEVPVLACTPCAKVRGVTEKDLIDGVRMGKSC
jgi:hypothetical protein